jgi:magnesium and cobalt transporter
MNMHFSNMANKDTDDALPPSKSEEEKKPSVLKSFVDGVMGIFEEKSSEATLKEAIEEVIEEHEEEGDDALSVQEKVMLHNVLSFGDVEVSDIMITRADIVAVPADISLEDLKSHIIRERHTRIPVYSKTLDQVEGFLHIKDLFAMIAEDQAYDIKKVLRPMIFVPPSMRVADLLVKMRRLGSHMAIVVDEYGGTDGLVTLEDLVEELVGDIQDEHDEEEALPAIKRISDHLVEADARVRIERLERELGLNLMSQTDGEDDFETLGGLIFFLTSRVPAKGEKITHESGLEFEILDADARRIHRVRIKV